MIWSRDINIFYSDFLQMPYHELVQLPPAGPDATCGWTSLWNSNSGRLQVDIFHEISSLLMQLKETTALRIVVLVLIASLQFLLQISIVSYPNFFNFHSLLTGCYGDLLYPEPAQTCMGTGNVCELSLPLFSAMYCKQRFCSVGFVLVILILTLVEGSRRLSSMRIQYP